MERRRALPRGRPDVVASVLFRLCPVLSSAHVGHDNSPAERLLLSSDGKQLISCSASHGCAWDVLSGMKFL